MVELWTFNCLSRLQTCNSLRAQTDQPTPLKTLLVIDTSICCMCVEHMSAFQFRICVCEYVCVWKDSGHWLYLAWELIYSTRHILSSCCILLCSVHLVSMELICLCLCPPVYSMGRSVGRLERLHHLFLPGCRRPVQGETFRSVSLFSFFSESFIVHLSARLSSLGWTMMNVLRFLRSQLQVIVADWWRNEAWFIFLRGSAVPPTRQVSFITNREPLS